jgi:hypothetical protein
VAALLALWLYDCDVFSLASSRELIILCMAYYAIDPLIWRAITSAWQAITSPLKGVGAVLPSAEQLRIGQIIVVAVLFVVFVYDTGTRDAASKQDAEVCENTTPAESNRIELEGVQDIVICAKVDWEKTWVYADFVYSKIDKDKLARFRKISFHAKCVGVPSERPKCEMNKDGCPQFP